MIPVRSMPIVVALGSNLGDRWRHLREAVWMLSPEISVVRLSSVWESEPVDCPPDAGLFLNMAISGVTCLTPSGVMEKLHRAEDEVGRRRRKTNDSRRIDLDLIFYGAVLSDKDNPRLPHPRYRSRAFVLEPIRELGLDWIVAGMRVSGMRGSGSVRRVGGLY